METKSTKKHYSVFLVQEDYEKFQRYCSEKLSNVSREVNLFMREEMKKGEESKNAVR